MTGHSPEKLKALIVLECGTKAPSATVRCLQYRELFNREGHEVTIVSRSSLFMSRLMQARRPLLAFLVNILRRQLCRLNGHITTLREDRIVRQARDVDVVYMLKISSLRLHERLHELDGPKILMDLNDGLWLPFFRESGWQDLERILELADAVICENQYGAEFARQHNSRVFLVSDAPQVELFDRARAEVKRDPRQIVLGWIGSPENTGSLYALWEPLEALFARHPNLHLRLVGANPDCLPHFEKVRWSIRPSYDQQSMIREVLAMDIGLFPLFNVESSRARGTLKAMIYMSGEAVAACQDLGENRSLISDGVNGVLAGSPAEWEQKLEWLIQSPRDRHRIAGAGLQTIRERFSQELCFGQLIQAFQQTREPGSRQIDAVPESNYASA
jgi:glycosyltransferase involved in cell wall biosynthesis